MGKATAAARSACAVFSCVQNSGKATSVGDYFLMCVPEKFSSTEGVEVGRGRELRLQLKQNNFLKLFSPGCCEVWRRLLSF